MGCSLPVRCLVRRGALDLSPARRSSSSSPANKRACLWTVLRLGIVRLRVIPRFRTPICKPRPFKLLSLPPFPTTTLRHHHLQAKAEIREATGTKEISRIEGKTGIKRTTGTPGTEEISRMGEIAGTTGKMEPGETSRVEEITGKMETGETSRVEGTAGILRHVLRRTPSAQVDSRRWHPSSHHSTLLF